MNPLHTLNDKDFITEFESGAVALSDWDHRGHERYARIAQAAGLWSGSGCGRSGRRAEAPDQNELMEEPMDCNPSAFLEQSSSR